MARKKRSASEELTDPIETSNIEARLAALKAERAEIFRRTRRRELGSEAASKLIREIDLLEARYSL